MFARVNVVKGFGTGVLGAGVALLVFMLVHTLAVRAAHPALVATTTALTGFIAAFGAYVVTASRRAP
jgi:hypothetical protein